MASRRSAAGWLLQRTLRSLAPQHPAPVCSRQCSSKLATQPERKPKVCPVDFVFGCFWWTFNGSKCLSTIWPPPTSVASYFCNCSLTSLYLWELWSSRTDFSISFSRFLTMLADKLYKPTFYDCENLKPSFFLIVIGRMVVRCFNDY